MSLLVSVQNNVSVPNGAGLTFNPLLVDPATGAAVAPDICIPIPKAAATSAAVTTAMAVGNLTVVHNNGAPQNFDILTIRLASMLRLIAPALLHPQTVARAFIIANGGNNASMGAVYADAANLGNLYQVISPKVAADGSTTLICERQPGGIADSTSATGTLNLISGTGSATIAWLTPGIQFPCYANIQNSVSVPNGAGGLTIHPGIMETSAYVPPVPGPYASPNIIPDICIPVPKTAPAAATNQSFVPTVLAGEPTGIEIETAEAGAVNHDILTFSPLVIQRLIAASLGQVNDRRRYFVISNATNASQGALYQDAANLNNQYVVQIPKVSGDGSTLLTCIRALSPAGIADNTSATGSLTLVSGTGDATIPWLTPGIKFEKYMDLRQNVAVANGAGLTFDPMLVVNGTPVMPQIVIPIPKATGTVAVVATNLLGAVGTVTVSHNNGAPQNFDILSINFLSLFRQ